MVRRKKFDRFLYPERRDELVAKTIVQSKFISTSTTITDCRDVADNKFLELAIDGQAAAIVTGDADLLTLHPFRGLPFSRPGFCGSALW